MLQIGGVYALATLLTCVVYSTDLVPLFDCHLSPFDRNVPRIGDLNVPP